MLTSWVLFGGTNELVIGWSDSDRILNLDPPPINPSIKTFWFGSNKYTVRVSQGNPYKISNTRWDYDEGYIDFNVNGKVQSWNQYDSQYPLKTGYTPPTKYILTSDNLLTCADNFITNDSVRCFNFITDMQNSVPQSLRAITQSAVEKLEKIGAEDHAKSFGGDLFSTPEVPSPTATPIPVIFTGKTGIFRYCKSETETTPEEAISWSGVKWRTGKFQVDKPWNVQYFGGPFLRMTVFKLPEDQPPGTPPQYDDEGTRISRDGIIFASIVTSDKFINDSWSTDDTGSYFFEVQSMKGFCLVVE